MSQLKLTPLQRIRKSRSVKGIIMLLALTIFSEAVAPMSALALTSGPASPEFSSFEPVATTDMVNDFTGDFTYNIPVVNVPGPDGAGYSMSLSYHSGASPEEEASWVGFGWTLNPGAINRSKRGLPDDYKDAEITKYNKVKPNWSSSSGFDFNVELNSNDNEKKEKGDKKGEDKGDMKFKFGGFNGIGDQTENISDDKNPFTQATFSLSHSIRYNNYSGFSSSKSIGGSYAGMASLSLSSSGGETSLGYSVNPLAILSNVISAKRMKNQRNGFKAAVEMDVPRLLLLAQKINKLNNVSKAIRVANYFSGSYSIRSYSSPAVPFSVSYNKGRAFNFSTSLQINPAIPVGFQIGIQGNSNFQVPYPEEVHSGYGYQYNNDRLALYADDRSKTTFEDLGSIKIYESDFFIEKESTFEKHDKNLSIPFNGADVFSGTGNGAIGGFQLTHNQVGHFYPNFLKNEQKILQLGLEVGIGGTIEVGFDIGLGFQKTVVDDWKKFQNETTRDALEFDQSAVPTLRFMGDMGGELSYSDHDALLKATIEDHGLNLNDFEVGGNVYNNQLKATREGRSSYIEYSVYNNGSLVNMLDNSLSTQFYAAFKNNSYNDLIGQIAVTDKSGSKMIYGIPVFTTNELELSIGLHQNDPDQSAYTVFHPLNSKFPSKNKTVVGSKTEKPWASTYLLTKSLTADYIDITGDGPSNDDFGGWTSMTYSCAYGDAANEWYRYRMPYNGLFYNRGKLNDLEDGTGSMSRGDKEVYYLNAIETKTHIAFFVTNKTTIGNFINDYQHIDLNSIEDHITGSGVTRKDGLGAKKDDDNVELESAANGNVKGTDHLQNLEKIVLFSKDDLSKPISTTFFEYDYTICPNTKNSEADGKLTLKRVWSEGGGISKSKISPYQFNYNYYRYDGQKDDIINARYPELLDVLQGITPSMENPNYVAGDLDAWGNYQINSQQRRKKMQTWLDQKHQNFDPAAWQLKRIILPSGGEIHVQYEQKNYSYVESERAAVMVPLSNQSGIGVESKNFGYKAGSNSRYYINEADLNLTNSNERSAYVSQLKDHFVTRHNKLYYKFLYSLRGDNSPVLQGGDKKLNWKREYITGYISVMDVKDDNGHIYLELGDSDKSGELDKNLPRWVGYKTLLSQGMYALVNNGSNVADQFYNHGNNMLNSAYNDGVMNFPGIKQTARNEMIPHTFNLFKEWLKGSFKKPQRKDICSKQNFELSYLKLPAYHSKKGGGCRVKRLLSYDPGINGETGDAMVYGTEYSYTLKGSDLSSGVATYEPSEIREENALVTIVERKKQKKIDKLFNGKDSKVFEGPIGESLYPAPSIGYSRIIVKNIHSGKTTTGFAINEYHTCKDFPMQVDYSELSKDDDTYKKRNFDLPLGMINISNHQAWVTQGYLFKLNDMHGKPKRQATYAGNYNKNLENNQQPTAETTYKYTKPGQTIKGLGFDPSNNNFQITDLQLGQEEDLTMYRSKIQDITNNFSLEIDLNITLPVLISLGFGFSYSYSKQELSQHVTNKVLHQKSFMISSTSTVDGVTQTTENIAFNKYTGDPVLTRTYDGFTSETEQTYLADNQGSDYESNGHYYALNIPASWVYTELGQKYVNPNNRNDLASGVGSMVTYGKNELYDAIKANSSDFNGAFTSVVSASQMILKKDLFTTNNPYYAYLNEEYSIGSNSGSALPKLNSIYYPYRSYIYRAKTKDAETDFIYNGGVLNDPVTFFNWLTVSNDNTDYPIYNDNWFSGSRILAYSPNGVALIEEDILGIKSVVKFSDDKTLPILTAQNANYNQVFFIDFEKIVNASISSSRAHTGKKSLNLIMNGNTPVIQNYNFTNLASRGAVMKLWLRSTLSEDVNNVNYGKKNPNPQLKALIEGHTYSFKKIAQTGEWTLYEAEIVNLYGMTGQKDISLTYNAASGENVLIDDVRIQPMDALMNCIVYSKDKKINAQFDDQHFAVFYEYNSEGALVRQSIETERGRKTVKEQQQNTPLINKN